jgi:hypothetical protein
MGARAMQSQACCVDKLACGGWNTALPTVVCQTPGTGADSRRCHLEGRIALYLVQQPSSEIRSSRVCKVLASMVPATPTRWARQLARPAKAPRSLKLPGAVFVGKHGTVVASKPMASAAPLTTILTCLPLIHLSASQRPH